MQRIIILLLAVLPLVPLVSSEAELYNMYLMNILLAVVVILTATESFLRNHCLYVSVIDVCLFAFLLISMISMQMKSAAWHPYIYINMSLLTVLIFLSKNIKQKDILLLKRLLICSILLMNLIILIGSIFLDGQSFGVLMNNKAGNINIIAIFLSVSICVLLHMMEHLPSLKLKILYLFFVIANCYVIYYIGCRTAYIVVASYFIFCRRSIQRFVQYLILTSGMSLCIWITFTNLSKLDSLTGRSFIIQNSMALIASNPFIGCGGIGSYAVQYPLQQVLYGQTDSVARNDAKLLYCTQERGVGVWQNEEPRQLGV